MKNDALKKTNFIWIFAVMLIMGCLSAAKKAQRTSTKEEAARQTENAQLEKMRKLYPCDTSTSTTVTKTVVKYLPAKQSTQPGAPCIPDTVETFVKDYTQHTVVDSAALKEANNRLKSSQYRFDSAQAEYAKEREGSSKTIAELTHANTIYKVGSDKWDSLIKWMLIIAGVLSAGTLVLLFIKFKSKIGL